MSRILKIITNPNPILRNKSEEIAIKEISSNKFQGLCSDMAKTMIESDGIGLAAPQIGKNIRVIVINTKNGELCMINPKITRKSWKKEWGEEGCLSVPDVFGQVKRHKKIKCRFLNTKAEPVEIEAEGLMARVIQHELDHLNGVLFIDKAKNIQNIKNIYPSGQERFGV